MSDRRICMTPDCGRSSLTDFCSECEAEALALDGGIYLGDPAPLSATENGNERVSTQRRLHLVPAETLERERVEWLEPRRIPLGAVTVLFGEGGLGKSQYTCALAARLSREGRTTLFATAEDSLTAVVIPRLEAVEADLRHIKFVTIQTAEGEDGFTLPDDVDELEKRIVETGACLLVVDPVVAHLSTKLDSRSDHSVRRALAPLHHLAERTRCAALGLMHSNKGQSGDAMRRLGGSVAFGAAARSVLLLARDPDDEDGERGSRRVLAHTKCNFAALAPSLSYEVQPIVLPATANAPEVDTSRLQLLGESEHEGRALLTWTGDDETRSALDDAQTFLFEELATGSVATKTLLANAKANGISEKTLRRAAEKVGAEKRKVGFQSGWEWHLPLSEDGQGG
jgi:RecA-family ATPase